MNKQLWFSQPNWINDVGFPCHKNSSSNYYHNSHESGNRECISGSDELINRVGRMLRDRKDAECWGLSPRFLKKSESIATVISAIFLLQLTWNSSVHYSLLFIIQSLNLCILVISSVCTTQHLNHATHDYWWFPQVFCIDTAQIPMKDLTGLNHFLMSFDKYHSYKVNIWLIKLISW